MSGIVSGALGVVGGLFGGTSARNQVNAAYKSPMGTNYGSSRQGGQVTIDPSIRGLRNTVLGQIPGLSTGLNTATNNAVGQYQSLLNQAGGNQNAYVQAMVDPLQQQLAQRGGDLQQNLGLRGVAGSSFGNQELTNFGIDSQRALGDARAQATNQSINQQSGLVGQQLGAQQSNFQGQQGLTQEQLQVANSNLQQELAALGIGNQGIDNLVNRANSLNDINGKQMDAIGGGITDILGSAGMMALFA
jgi:hypothetical protein